jgi:hypothetical protein
LTTEERLSDIVEILAHGLLWLDAFLSTCARTLAVALHLLTSLHGTLLPRANAAARPQLAKADFASSPQHVREGQRIAELEAEIDALQRQALALGAEPTADVPAWVLLGVKIDQCPHSAEGDMRALNKGLGFDPTRTLAALANGKQLAKSSPLTS